jgi:hypothetical protein
MALKLCKNGHLTGYRHCATCGTNSTTPVSGDGFVQVPRHELRKENAKLAKAAVTGR